MADADATDKGGLFYAHLYVIWWVCVSGLVIIYIWLFGYHKESKISKYRLNQLHSSVLRVQRFEAEHGNYIVNTR